MKINNEASRIAADSGQDSVNMDLNTGFNEEECSSQPSDGRKQYVEQTADRLIEENMEAFLELAK